jgi:hypothetical protein
MKKRLEYILNPEKTEGMFFCNSHNCFPNAEDAYMNMKYIYENFTHHKFEEPLPKQGKARVKLLHYVQSFPPDDNVTPELAHRMGRAWARKSFGDNVQMVIATHTDKAHIHNHVIINVFGLDGHKYNSNKKTLSEIREHSDRVCIAFGLQPIMNNKHLGMSYKEWDSRRKGASWKEQIRREIDTLVLTSKNFDELAGTLEEKGYAIRYGERTAIRAPGQKYFTNLKTLDDNYTIDNLKSRIQWKDDMGNASRDDVYNKGHVLTMCFAGIISQLAKRVVDGTRREKKRDEDLPYLPHNDRDVFQLCAQLSLINRLNIHSIGEVEAKIEKTRAEHDKAIAEFNAITEEHHKLTDLSDQWDNICELEDKHDKTIADKMKISLARQSLSRHGISSLDDVRRLELRKREYDERIAELQRKIEDSDNLAKALQEIADTYNGISKGDYISKLIERDNAQPEHEVKQSAPGRSAPKPDEPTQNPITKTTSRGRKH